MKKRLVFVPGILLVILFLSGICLGDDTPGYLVLVQGGGNTLHDGVPGTVLTIEDTVPYVAYLTDKSFLKPTDIGISPITGSIYAAIVRDEKNNQSISIGLISHPLYSKETRELSFEITPLTFYDGSLLRNFADHQQELTSDYIDNGILTRVYLEIHQKIPENSDPILVDGQIT